MLSPTVLDVAGDDDGDGGAAIATATKPLEPSTWLLESATAKVFPDSAASTATATATMPMKFVRATPAAVSTSNYTVDVSASDAIAAAAVTATTTWLLEPALAVPVAVFPVDSTTTTVAADVSSLPSLRCSFCDFSCFFVLAPKRYHMQLPNASDST